VTEFGLGRFREIKELQTAEEVNEFLKVNPGWSLINGGKEWSVLTVDGKVLTRLVYTVGKEQPRESRMGSVSEQPKSEPPVETQSMLAQPSTVSPSAKPVPSPRFASPNTNLVKAMESMKWTRSQWGEYAFLRKQDGFQTPEQRAMQEAIQNAGKALILDGYRIRITKNTYFDRRRLEELGK
jgi:hypothetical protein